MMRIVMYMAACMSLWLGSHASGVCWLHLLCSPPQRIHTARSERVSNRQAVQRRSGLTPSFQVFCQVMREEQSLTVFGVGHSLTF